MTLTLQLFGAVTLLRDSVPLPRPRIRKDYWLLALLALRRDRETDRSFLAGTLWPDIAESQALFYLRRSLNELRQVLGPDASCLTAPTARTLRLAPDSMEVDVLTFDAAIANGGTASLENAVALYRGDLLHGCDELWVVPERETRRTAYVTALHRLAREKTPADVAAALSCLRRAVDIDPLNESIQRTLMETLILSGDFAQAQQSYRQFRLRLRDELQSEPAPETTAMYHQVRERARQAVASRVMVKPPRPMKLDRSATLQSQGSNDLALPSNNLPRQLTSFIGREKEIADVRRLLQQGALLTLIGVGGSGKTRLSLEAAAEILKDCPEDYPDGVWLVELASIEDPALVPHAVATVVGVREDAGCPLLQTLLSSLQNRRLLLVLDNCEHLAAACAELATALLRSCPQVKVLVSSREALGITGEQLYRVPLLTLPDPIQPLSWEHFSRYEAVQLFVERASLVRPDFAVTAANASAVAAVCQRLDGLPLALELAAARIRGLGIEMIRTRLDDRFRLLTGGDRSALPRHQTLRALMDWSYDLLSEPEKRLLARLSVFAGGWTLEAAERVCGDFGFGILDFGLDPAALTGTSPPFASRPLPTNRDTAGIPPIQNLKSQIQNDDVLVLLMSLVDKSLVSMEEQEGATRYRLLETVRQYAVEKLLASGEAAETRSRHRDCFLALAEEAYPQLIGSEPYHWLERLETEHDNVRAALAWCVEEVEGAEAALRFVGVLSRFWMMRGYWNEGRTHLKRALGRVGAQKRTRERASALDWAGFLAFVQGNSSDALALFEESLDVFTELEDEYGIARVLGHLGNMAAVQGDYTTGRTQLEESLRLFRESEDKPGIAWSLSVLGRIAKDTEDYTTARALLEENLGLNREMEDKNGIAWGLVYLGPVVSLQGDHAMAQAQIEEGLRLFRELGDKFGICFALTRLGKVVAEQGDYAAAWTSRHEALRLHRELGNKHGIAYALEGLAEALAAQANCAQATCLWGAAAALRRSVGFPLPLNEQVMYNRQVAMARAALGDDAFATAWEQGRTLTWEQAADSVLTADCIIPRSKRPGE